MKNLNLTFAAIIFAFFALTSCQKEALNDIAPVEDMPQRTLPAEGINIVNKDVKTLGKIDNGQATSRARQVTFIKDINQPVYGTTKGQGNSLDRTNAPCLDPNGYRFDGQDAAYYFTIEKEEFVIADISTTYSVSLTDLHADLDLFVYTVDRYGYIDQCKGISMNGYNADEEIELGELNPGSYVILIDGWHSSIACSFTLKVDKKVEGTLLPPAPVNPQVNINSMRGVIYGTSDNEQFMDKVVGHFGTEWQVENPDGSYTSYKETNKTATTLTIKNETIEETINMRETVTRTIVIDIAEYTVTGTEAVIRETADGAIGASSQWYANIIEIN